MGRNNQQRFANELPKIFRDIFSRPSKHKISHLTKEMTTLSTVLIESPPTIPTSPSITNNEHAHDVCLVSDSPHYVVRVRFHIHLFPIILTYIFKIAGTGNVQEFEKHICEDPSKLTVFNPAGLCAAHNAAARNKVAILTLIVQYNGGNINDLFKRFYRVKYSRFEYRR